LVDRSSDIGTAWNSSATAGEEQATDLRLVRPETETAANNGNGSGKNRRKAKKSTNKEKADTGPTSSPPAKTKKSKRVPTYDSKGVSPGEDLDTTGWSGDYNLPK